MKTVKYQNVQNARWKEDCPSGVLEEKGQSEWMRFQWTYNSTLNNFSLYREYIQKPEKEHQF